MECCIHFRELRLTETIIIQHLNYGIMFVCMKIKMSTALASSNLFTPFTHFCDLSLSLSQYNDLLKKKSIVEKDKAKIAEVKLWKESKQGE